MNIKQAKEQIRNTLRAYLSRDELGNYRIPAVCHVRLTTGGKTLFESRIPVYQLGLEVLYPLK